MPSLTPLKNQISQLSLTLAMAASGSCMAAQMPPGGVRPLNLDPHNASIEVIKNAGSPETVTFTANFYGVRSTATRPCAPLEQFRNMMLNSWVQRQVEDGLIADAQDDMKSLLKGRTPTLLEGDADQAVFTYAFKALQASYKAADLCFPHK